MKTTKQSQCALSNCNGFTIIEIMIALAVGGLILFMMLSIIPALIRNSHNNQRKQDVAAILDAISHYQLSNSGNFPQTTALRAQLNSYSKLSFYEVGSITSEKPVDNTHYTIANVSEDEVKVFNFRICDNDNNEATNIGAGYRAIVAIYRIETSGGTAFKCQDL